MDAVVWTWLPVVAAAAVSFAIADRIFRALERRGIIIARRDWRAAGVGNALLELHVALQPEAVRIVQMVEATVPDEDRVGDGRPRPTNVISLADARRRRAHAGCTSQPAGPAIQE